MNPQQALVSPNGEQYDSLLRQLRDRMVEGCGETIYVVGMGSGETHRAHEANYSSSTLWKITNSLISDFVNQSSILPRAVCCVMYSPLVPLPPPSDGGDWGLDEKDMAASVATVHSMCEQVDADLIPLRERNEAAGLVHDYLIRRRVGELDFLEVR